MKTVLLRWLRRIVDKQCAHGCYDFQVDRCMIGRCDGLRQFVRNFRP